MPTPQTKHESRWIGRVLRDKWRIDRRIARGGMGTVFAATHKNNGSTAAIKILHAEFSRDADTRSRFLQEGYAANQVNHPGVVRILDDDVAIEIHAFDETNTRIRPDRIAKMIEDAGAGMVAPCLPPPHAPIPALMPPRSRPRAKAGWCMSATRSQA